MERMKELIVLLNKAACAYYQEDKEIMSDHEYDKLYDELLQLEKKTNTILANSPTQKVGYTVLSNLKKIKHDVPILSLDKTKEVEKLKEFLKEQKGILSWKLDGLTIVLTYQQGELVQAVTRGNGSIGEDVTHNANVAITGDSDLLIVCQNSNDKFSCIANGIESLDLYNYISINSKMEGKKILLIAAEILDGGKEALRKRVRKIGYKDIFYKEKL